MLKTFSLVLGALAFLTFAQPAVAAVEIGDTAPDFEGTNVLTGDIVKLSDLKGKTVILEWTNKECPYVQKHYDSGNMQKIQQQAHDEHGAYWITINSSAEGKQGHVGAEDAKKIVEDAQSKADAYILDTAGSTGKLYNAQTTPHMFIIDGEGKLVYKGAIDSDSSADPATIAGATNYVTAALAEMKEGKAVTHASTQAYGCSVKY